MWRMVRLLKKNRLALAIVASRKDSEHSFNRRVTEITIERFEERGGGKLQGEEHEELLDSILADVRSDLEKIKPLLLEGVFYEYHREARVNRHDLEEMYLAAKLPETNIYSIDDEVERDKCRSMRIEYNSILQSCIDNIEPYIKEDEDDKAKVFLTVDGKKFAGIDGLLKAEIAEMGILWTIVVSVAFTVIGAVNLGLLKDITASVSPWW